MRWGTMLVGATLAFTLAAGTSALAITGSRQGCLSVVNNMYQTLIVHVRRASKDGDYRVGALTAVFLDPDTLRVTENSILSADGADIPEWHAPAMALKDDPNTAYTVDLHAPYFPQCTAGWLKRFLRSTTGEDQQILGRSRPVQLVWGLVVDQKPLVPPVARYWSVH